MRKGLIHFVFLVSCIIIFMSAATANFFNPSGYWKFNQSSGNATDETGNNNKLILQGSPPYVIGKLGNATNTEYVAPDKNWLKTETNNQTPWTFGTGDFTIAYWFKVGGRGAAVHNFRPGSWAGNNGWGIYSESDLTIKIVVPGTDLMSIYHGGDLFDGNYHRVIWARYNNNNTVYIDGALVNSTLDSTDFNYEGNLTIGSGASGYDPDNLNNGFVDDLRVYKGYAWGIFEVQTDWLSGSGSELPTSPNPQVFNNLTIEGTLEEFKINVTYDSSIYDTINPILVYNGTNHTAIELNSGSNYSEFLATFYVPSVDESTNLTFYWDILFDSSRFVSLSNNQTVQVLNIGSCTEYSNLLLNFTTYDEELKTFLDGATIESAVNIYDINRTERIANYSNSTISQSPICSGINLTLLNQYSLDAVIKYFKNGYAIEYYNILNATFNASFQAQHIKLYDLNVTDSTEFEVTLTGNDFLPLGGALVYLDREYVSDNTFLTVEAPLTDTQGKTILHMVGSDIHYNIRVIDIDGSLLATFINIVPYCPNPDFTDCQISLSATSASDLLDYDNIAGLIFSTTPIYNATTGRVTFDFVVPGGLTKLVALNVTRSDVFGNRTVCANSLSSASGTLICNVGNITNTYLISIVSVNGVPVLISKIDIDKSDFGSIGFIAWFILSLVLILIFAESKNGIMISLLISYIGAVVLGLSNGTIVGIGSAGIWIIIVTGLSIWKLNKERQQ